MPTLATWGGRSKFRYSGSIASGTQIIYGKSRKIDVSGRDYAALLKHFKGKTVPVGTSRTIPPKNSLGDWLNKAKKTAIGSYVAPILVSTGHAKRVGINIQIL
jgi:hypothetical protein